MAPGPPALTLLTLLLTATLCDAQWQWTCQSGLCVRGEQPEPAPTAPPQASMRAPWPSQRLCRLTCGPWGALWPRPTGDTWLDDALTPFQLSSVRFDLSGVGSNDSDASAEARQLLEAASERWLEDVARAVTAAGGSPRAGPASSEVLVAVHTLADAVPPLDWDVDESYSLAVQTSGGAVRVSLLAGCAWGALHGLQTLRQLVGCCDGAGAALLVAAARLSDAPAYPHRGLLLDSGRNFLPAADIRRTIDAMAAAKLNVLHWHATDSQSFPLQLPRLPQLAKWGAASPEQTYSPRQVSALVAFARARGVRLLLELDAPAHAGQGWQWGEAAGEGRLALCVAQQPWRRLCVQPPCGQLNPANPRLYPVLADLYRDVVQLWPPRQPLHMGGDEVSYSCWNSSAEVVQYMRTRGWPLTQDGYLRLWAEFQQKALEALDAARGSSDVPAILWSSHLTQPGNVERYLNSSRYVIETWVEASDPLPQQLLSLGYRLIVATKDAWYLDHGFWGSTRYHDWRVAYDNQLPGAREAGVLGGEAASWGELVDGQGLDARVWPRAAAVAERLWTNPSSNSRDALPRLFAHRERLVAAGVRAEALAPGFCVLNEGACY